MVIILNNIYKQSVIIYKESVITLMFPHFVAWNKD